MLPGGGTLLRNPALLVVVACGLDRLLGDPHQFPHPVQVMGWAIGHLRRLSEAWAADTPWKLRLCGTGLAALVVLAAAGSGWLVERWAWDGSLLATVALVVGLASALAGGSLERAVRQVLQALPDLELARQRLAWIVGREVADLPEADILRAAAETTAENAVDGLFAPLFWILVGAATQAVWSAAPGPLALGWAFKAASTLDSMLGYRRGRLRWLGTAGARLDDGLTWLPARLVALSLPLVCARPWQGLWQFPLVLREGRPDPSPNAGLSQAAYAQVVAVQLGGWNRYADGWRHKPLVGRGYPAVNRQAVETMLALSLRLEVLWLLCFGVGWHLTGGRAQ